MSGYVYAGEVNAERLRGIIQNLSGAVTLTWDLKRLDFSGELREAGCAFNPTTEIRWEQAGDRFRVLVLSDEERPDLGLARVQGEWKIQDDANLRLIDINDRRYSPQFEYYPQAREPKARLKCRVYLRNGVAAFISPREILRDDATTPTS